MAQTLRHALVYPSWAEWERIECPALVVRAGNGMIEPETARQITERLPGARLAEIPGAAHDVHLDRPREWRDTLTAFLDSLENSVSGTNFSGA
jgi:pimeloyl-ACP methyl ester carboxylesterase